ncbi:MAG: MarR family transcriptional regulator [Nostocoides sp.]
MVIAPAPQAVAIKATARDRVLHTISGQGPVSAARIGELLGLTPTAIRRHLDHLTEGGFIEEHEATAKRRGRGRPARSYVVSPAGHRTLDSDYDHLAGQAVRFLAETAGPAAVEAFAQQRAAELEGRYAGLLDAVGDRPDDRAQALVDALTVDGYSASARTVGQPGATTQLTGIQLCQGHCPVQHVAAEFPQFCDAETEAFSRLLGVHVQRLATLAHGDHVCTTFIPTPAVPPKEGSIR